MLYWHLFQPALVGATKIRYFWRSNFSRTQILQRQHRVSQFCQISFVTSVITAQFWKQSNLHHLLPYLTVILCTRYTPTSTPSSLLDDSCGQGCPQCFAPLDLDHSAELRNNTKDNIVKEVKDAKEKRIRVEGSFLAITSATVTCSCRHTKPGGSK